MMKEEIKLGLNGLPVYQSPEAAVEVLRPSDPIYCVRPKKITNVAQKFLDGFPGDVLYAVKSNPGPHILKTLFDVGITHFDTASIEEIKLVSSLSPDAKSYFMHPVKSRAAIYSSYESYDVRHYVIDHPAELKKITELIAPGPHVTILVRIAVEHPGAAYELSSKFGTSVDLAVTLTKEILRIGYSYGIAFHVGSQCLEPRAYRLGLSLVDDMLTELPESPSCVDVGGGFPTSYLNSHGPSLETYLSEIKLARLQSRVPESCRLLCEPGRSISAEGESVIVQVQLRKGDCLYLNDGMYGSMIEEKYGMRLPTRIVESRKFSEEYREFTAYGPTCDALDVFPAVLRLPLDVEEGDWIEFGLIGAYGTACRTRFNGFYPDCFVQVDNDFGVIE